MTAANVVTYEQVPVAALQSSSVTLGSTSVSLGATANSLTNLSSVGLGTNGSNTGQLTLDNSASSGATTTVQPSALTTTAWTMTLPPTNGSSGYFLQTDGTGNTTWAAGSSGTVTSVTMSVPAFLSVGGGPITSSGTLAVTLAPENANVIFAGPTSGGAAAPAFRSLIAADIPTLPNSNLQNSSVTLGTTNVALGATASSLAALSSVGLGVNGATTGVVTLANGASGGATTTVQPSTLTTTAWTMTLPSTEGSSGQVLQTDGSGNTSWISAATGSVTSVNMNVPTFMSVAGGPITSSGTLTVSYGSENANLIFAGPTGGAPGAPAFRSLVAGDIPTLPNSNLQNNSVTLGTTNVALGATASSLAALNSVGLGINGTTTGTLTMANAASGGDTTTVQPSTLTMTAWTMTLPANKGTNAYVLQTDGSGNTSWVAQAGSGTVNSGTTSQLAYYAANGTAVSGLTAAANGVLVTNASSVPSISAALPAAVQGNITSVGTVTSGTWNGTTITIANGGTGQTTAAAAFNALNPMTTLGDVMYDSGGTTASRLAGNTATTKMYLSQTGTGSASAAPVWAQIAFGDISGVPTATTSAQGLMEVGSGLSVSSGTVSLATTGASGAYINGGNSFGTAATLGTNDANTLALKTNNATAVTIDASQHVGIGTTNPATAALDARFSDSIGNDVARVENTNSAGLSSFGAYDNTGQWQMSLGYANPSYAVGL